MMGATNQWERYPARRMLIRNPKEYLDMPNEARQSEWTNDQNCWIINGRITKCDANFRRNFIYAAVPFEALYKDQKLFMASAPHSEADFKMLEEIDVRAILNLTDNEYQREDENIADRANIFVQNFTIQEFQSLGNLS